MTEHDNFASASELKDILTLVNVFNQGSVNTLGLETKVSDCNGENLGKIDIGPDGQYVFYFGGTND